jgi:glycerol-3-phosphate O-acyltransferase / dihydroxyacetone phosphate acyltransferase
MLRHPVLFLVYYTLYGLVRAMLRYYYREIRVEGFPERDPKGPLIVLSNHPNAMMDPLLIVSRLRRPVFFLANAGLFRHPFANWFLNTFYCIPVERPKDVDRPIDNADSFRRAREHLEGGGALYIAPEGTSYREYRLRPLKTGTARIALDLLRSGKTKEVHFLMAGIQYAAPPAFRSRLLLRYAPLLTLRREDLSGDITDWEHVSELTLRLKHRMESLLPHGSPDQDAALTIAAGMLAPALRTPDWSSRLYALRDHLHHQDESPGAWVEGLGALLREKGLAELDPAWLSVLPRRPIFRWLLAPLSAWVLLHHLPFFGLAEWLRHRLGADPVYDATVRSLSGLVFLPLSLGLWYAIYASLEWGALAVWGYLMALLALGPWSWQQAQPWKDDQSQRRLRRAALADPAWRSRLEAHLMPLTKRWP